VGRAVNRLAVWVGAAWLITQAIPASAEPDYSQFARGLQPSLERLDAAALMAVAAAQGPDEHLRACALHVASNVKDVRSEVERERQQALRIAGLNEPRMAAAFGKVLRDEKALTADHIEKASTLTAGRKEACSSRTIDRIVDEAISAFSAARTEMLAELPE
jgi:hypothetical protein